MRPSGDLAAVGAVDLVAVVLGGVVAGRYTDARAAAQVAHRPGKGGRGFQPGVKVGRDAVGGQHPGGFPAEQFALAAAVVGDGHLLGQVGAVQVVGQALGGPADGVDVHAVGAGADDAPQPAGAEFQVPVKAVCDGGLVPGNAVQFGGQVVGQVGLGQPAAVTVLVVVHGIHSLSLGGGGSAAASLYHRRAAMCGPPGTFLAVQPRTVRSVRSRMFSALSPS